MKREYFLVHTFLPLVLCVCLFLALPPSSHFLLVLLLLLFFSFNLSYVQEKRAELSRLAHAVVQVEKFCPEACCVVGNYYSLKGRHESAVTYFQRAIKLNSK